MARERFQSCIDACNACADACNRCAVACLFEPDRHELTRCIQLDMDCQEICRLASSYMARESELVTEVCSFCADACAACAEECERHSMDHCRRCAEACRDCANQCQRMLSIVDATKVGAIRPGAH